MIPPAGTRRRGAKRDEITLGEVALVIGQCLVLGCEASRARQERFMTRFLPGRPARRLFFCTSAAVCVAFPGCCWDVRGGGGVAGRPPSQSAPLEPKWMEVLSTRLLTHFRRHKTSRPPLTTLRRCARGEAELLCFPRKGLGLFFFLGASPKPRRK